MPSRWLQPVTARTGGAGSVGVKQGAQCLLKQEYMAC
jgi:hypothetical protein